MAVTTRSVRDRLLVAGILDEIIVDQDRGEDVEIQVVRARWKPMVLDAKFTEAMIFTTDQYLDTNSGRSIDTNEAIREYARERGYKLKSSGFIIDALREHNFDARKVLLAVYDRETHAQVEADKVRKQISENPEYTGRAGEIAEVHRRRSKKLAEAEKMVGMLKSRLSKAQYDLRRESERQLDELAEQVIDDADVPEVALDAKTRSDPKRALMPHRNGEGPSLGVRASHASSVMPTQQDLHEALEMLGKVEELLS